MNISIDRFQDAHHHATSVTGWDQAYYQISAGTLNSSLMQFNAGRVHVFRETLNQKMLQHGAAPRDRLCFAIPITAKSGARMQGREVSDDCILVMRGGDEFMFHVPAGMEVLAVTVDRSEMDSECLFDGRGMDALLRQPVHRVASAPLAALRSQLVAACEDVFSHPADHCTGRSEEALAHTLIDSIFSLLVEPQVPRDAIGSTTTRNYVFEKCHRIALAERASPPSVIDLCQRLHVSRRTVQYSFIEEVDMSPTQYLRCLRLNGARQDLISTASQELSIGDAAAAWGFFHLSHFAADYRDLFGELPSQTERRLGPPRKAARNH